MSGDAKLDYVSANVFSGSWLCENARTLRGDRISHSLKTVFVVKRASALNLENELKNVIPAEFRSFAFLHSQGQMRRTQSEQILSAIPAERTSMTRAVTSLI